MSKRIAHTGVALFAAVLAPSLAIIIYGAHHPSFRNPVQRGDMLPPVGLVDLDGRTARLRASAGSYLVVVGAPSMQLSASQSSWVNQLVARVEATVASRTVVVTGELHPTLSATAICPTATSLLIDEDRLLMPVLNGGSPSAAVCVIDDKGRVLFNAAAPESVSDAPQQMELATAQLLRVLGSAAIATR